uniref:Uncharacterized protein n=1 Tax=Salix viminalis TaxID=40686 RepID=A0A6N2M398_SALVM
MKLRKSHTQLMFLGIQSRGEKPSLGFNTYDMANITTSYSRYKEEYDGLITRNNREEIGSFSIYNYSTLNQYGVALIREDRLSADIQSC